MIAFLGIQLVLLFVLSYCAMKQVFIFHKNTIPLNDSTIKIVFSYLGAYMTSVIVELIAMLNFIVKRVFDTSISGLADSFINLKSNKNKNKTD